MSLLTLSACKSSPPLVFEKYSNWDLTVIERENLRDDDFRNDDKFKNIFVDHMTLDEQDKFLKKLHEKHHSHKKFFSSGTDIFLNGVKGGVPGIVAGIVFKQLINQPKQRLGFSDVLISEERINNLHEVTNDAISLSIFQDVESLLNDIREKYGYEVKCEINCDFNTPYKFYYYSKNKYKRAYRFTQIDSSKVKTFISAPPIFFAAFCSTEYADVPEALQSQFFDNKKILKRGKYKNFIVSFNIPATNHTIDLNYGLEHEYIKGWPLYTRIYRPFYTADNISNDKCPIHASSRTVSRFNDFGRKLYSLASKHIDGYIFKRGAIGLVNEDYYFLQGTTADTLRGTKLVKTESTKPSIKKEI